MGCVNMSKSIITTPTPSNLNLKPRSDFDVTEFDVLIAQKGYDCYYEAAIKCPCKTKGIQSANIGCRNCGGSGWVFLTKFQTKIALLSLNMNTKYFNWTAANIGTVSVTTYSDVQMNYMDRITIIGSEALYCQVLYPVKIVELFAYTVYDINEITDIFMFESNDQPLKKLVEGDDYTFSKNKIIFDDIYSSVNNLTVSVKYSYNITFNIIDIVKEIRDFYVINNGVDGKVHFPVNAIARRSHYIFDQEGSLTFDNSI